MNEKGLLIVISGPSGSGKGTVLAKLFEKRAGLYYSVSATTRAPRPGETDGRDYYFMQKDEFERDIAEGRMLEHADYCGSYYGTPRAPVEQQLARGEDVILEIEVQGARQIISSCPEAVTIFLMPPSLDELERRLRGRGTESDEKIRGRLETAKKEMSAARGYGHIVVNDNVERAVGEISHIIDFEKRRRRAAGAVK
jgi:guanylate kinase